MIISEITISYPYMRYKVKVSHFTARRSTAIEWIILESINRCDTLQQYAGIPISVFFEQIFAISDADLLIRPCLIDLHDMGAISILGIDNETKLSTIPMHSLKLTKTGKEMQMKGLLPGTTAEDTFTIYYDLIDKILREDSLLHNETATGIKVMDSEEIDSIDFPASTIRDWLISIQGNKGRNQMNWLSPTTKIQDITSLESVVLWKNIVKKVDLIHGMQWQIIGEKNEAFHEISLREAEFPCPEELKNLPKLDITSPDDEIKQFIPILEVSLFIKNYQLKDDLFFVDEKYYTELPTDQVSKRKKLRVGFVFGSDSLKVWSKGKQLIIRIPDRIGTNILYGNANAVVQAGVITVIAGNTAKDMTITYIPKETPLKLVEELLPYIDKYYENDSRILFALIEIGLKELFFEYVARLVKKEINIGKKSEIIDLINSQSIGYYNQKLVSSLDKERLVVNAEYISKRCKNIDAAVSILEEFSAVNSLRQDESLIQRVIQIVLEAVGEINDLNEIWHLWSAIGKIKKFHLNWINKNGLYRGIYSNSCIFDLLGQFSCDDLFSIKEYTPVEQIILNMKRICIRIQEFLPEMDIYASTSNEKYSEIVIKHMNDLSNLYEQIRLWKDEEQRFNSKIMDVEHLNLAGISYANVKINIDGLSNTLAQFFDDSVMKYDKIYIVDTCTLMHDPGLISWFDDGKALLIVPLVVLEELDRKKSSNDESEAFSARDAIRNINNYHEYEWLATGEKSYPELLSDDLDKERNDNKILSIALRYIVKKPIILTDDINFGNIADAHKIENMKLSSYKAMKEHEKLSKQAPRKKNKKQNKRKNLR